MNSWSFGNITATLFVTVVGGVIVGLILAWVPGLHSSLNFNIALPNPIILLITGFVANLIGGVLLRISASCLAMGLIFIGEVATFVGVVEIAYRLITK